MAGSLEDWWREMPFVTKYLFAGSLLVTLAGLANFHIIHWMHLTLDFDLIYHRFHIWRFVTAFLFHGKLGFPFLINLMFLIQYGASVERNTFGNNRADYLFFILFSAGLLLIPAYILQMRILGESLILAIIYIWSRKNPDNQMNLMGMFNFQSMYFPWVLIGFRLLMGGSPIAELMGVLVGHVFYFLNDLYPLQTGRRLISTPQFLRDFFPDGVPRAANFGGGINWGQGRRLGD